MKKLKEINWLMYEHNKFKLRNKNIFHIECNNLKKRRLFRLSCHNHFVLFGKAFYDFKSLRGLNYPLLNKLFIHWLYYFMLEKYKKKIISPFNAKIMFGK